MRHSCFAACTFVQLHSQVSSTAKILTHFIISIAVLENVPPDAGLQKRATFSTLNVGLAGIGNRTRATWQAAALTAKPSTTPFDPLHQTSEGLQRSDNQTQA
jgi:hypothetical protein